MKFTFNLNLCIQVLSTIAHVLNLAGGVFPEGSDTKAKIMLGLAIVQGVSGSLAHYKNPDGTPAEDAYKK